MGTDVWKNLVLIRVMHFLTRSNQLLENWIFVPWYKLGFTTDQNGIFFGIC